MTDNNLISVVAGAVLAILTSFVTQTAADWREVKKRRQRLRRLLDSELRPCLRRLVSFVEFFRDKHEPEPALLFALERSVLAFERERADLYLLESHTDRQMIEFFDRLSGSIEVLREILKVAGPGRFESWAKSRAHAEVEVLEKLASEGAALANLPARSKDESRLTVD